MFAVIRNYGRGDDNSIYRLAKTFREAVELVPVGRIAEFEKKEVRALLEQAVIAPGLVTEIDGAYIWKLEG